MYQHTCIKCRDTYEDTDPDAYYCVPCNKERLVKAAEIDAKVGSTVGQQPNSLYTQYQKAQKVNGLVRADDLMNFI